MCVGVMLLKEYLVVRTVMVNSELSEELAL